MFLITLLLNHRCGTFLFVYLLKNKNINYNRNNFKVCRQKPPKQSTYKISNYLCNIIGHIVTCTHIYLY